MRAIAWIPRTITHYRKEIMRLLAEVSFGSGALIVILGTAGVMASLSLFVGSLVGLQASARSTRWVSRPSPGSSPPTSTPVTSRRSSPPRR